MKVHKVLRLPRTLHIQRRCPADARAYIRPLGKQQSAVPATRSAHGGSQSTAPVRKSAHCTSSAGAQPTPGRTSDPLASSKVLCLPRDLRTEVHKVLRLPRNLHMKVHKVLRLPRNLHIQRRCPADARAYIRPLGRQQSAVPATRSAHGGSQSTAPATKSAREGSQSAAPATKSAHQAPVPSRRQGVHPSLKIHKVLRLPRNLHIQRRCPADARAYIRPLGTQQKCSACHEICARRFTKYCACHEICT